MEGQIFNAFGKKELLHFHRALRQFVRTSGGAGFYEKDMAHPTYAFGAAGKNDPEFCQDGPDTNIHYGQLHAVEEALEKKNLIKPEERVAKDWEGFCRHVLKLRKRSKA